MKSAVPSPAPAGHPLHRLASPLGLAVLLIVAVTIFRLCYVPHLELVGDEAYYWLWAKHPDYCYLDKGPMTALFIAAGTEIGGDTVLGVRLFAVLLSTGTMVGVFVLARRLFNERVALYATVLALVVPLFAVGSILMTIDTVYIFFWTWAAVVFWKAVETQKAAHWLLAGALVGGGILSKYTAAVELLSFLLFCGWHREARRSLLRPAFYLLPGVALLCFVPALVWNTQHHWPTVHWLSHRGSLDQHFQLSSAEAFKFLGSQIGVVSPLLFVGLMGAIFWPRLAPAMQPGLRYVLSLFLPLFLFYVLLSFQRAAQANWAAASYISGVILLAARLEPLLQRSAWAQFGTAAALSVALLETVALHNTTWLHLPRGRDPLDRARGSRDLAAQIEQLQKTTGASFIVANKYMTASLLSFYLPDHPTTFMPVDTPPFNQFIIWPTYREKFTTGSALYVSDFAKVPKSLKADFPHLQPIAEIHTQQDGRSIGVFHVYWCERAGMSYTPRQPSTTASE
ncbi:MAG: glycosyltransferase family 39 protein [Chthoniobacteraceae bacterium]